jgi:hypothetical protein
MYVLYPCKAMENTSHRHQITNQKLIYEFDQVTFVCNHRAIYILHAIRNVSAPAIRQPMASLLTYYCLVLSLLLPIRIRQKLDFTSFNSLLPVPKTSDPSTVSYPF